MGGRNFLYWGYGGFGGLIAYREGVQFGDFLIWCRSGFGTVFGLGGVYYCVLLVGL